MQKELLNCSSTKNDGSWSPQREQSPTPMIHNKVSCVSFVLYLVSSSKGNYEETPSDYDRAWEGYSQTSFGNVSFSREDHQQDSFKYISHATLGSRSVETENTYLDLTRFIRDKQYSKGIKEARVKSLLKNVPSFSGFFEVGNGSNMFFWYFPPLAKHLIYDRTTPVIVWVQAAMALPGEFAALRLNGPMHLNPDGKVTFNKHSWAEAAHLIYFDSPVGVGHSFSSTKNYPTNQRAIAAELFSALRQFCDLFRLGERPLFIAGQGYAGKTIAALGAMMHREKKEYTFNLQGVAIGNGFIDPPNMLEYGKLLYQLGFIDQAAREEFHHARRAIQSLLREKKFDEAMDGYSEYFERSLEKGAERPFIDEVMGIASKYNFTQVVKGVHEGTLLERFLKNNITQRALHTTGVPFVKINVDVMKALWPELLRTQVRNFKLLMENYKVLLYNGQMSIKNAYPLVMNFLQKMRLKDAKDFNEADRNQWLIDGEIAGYFKTGGGLTEVLVRNAGLHVPTDQPKWAQRMINNFIHGKSMND